MAISILYNPTPLTLYEADGDRASGALAYFYLARTTTPLPVYLDAPLATPHPWPVVATAYGVLPPIYIPKGTEYKVQITDALGSLLYAADGIDNPAVPTEGGGGSGGGIVVTEDQIRTTGQFDWQPIDAARAGWVRCNGGTISSATGSGTERRNNDCEDLFSFYWDTFDDTVATVSPGPRGANAGADWASNKTIKLLDMRGFGAVGLDTMGATAAAGRLQKVTPINTTNASASIVVPSPQGITAGMFVKAAGIPDGTKVASVNVSAVTLTANATATATGVSATFSMFADANKPGLAGGEAAHKMEPNEIAAHKHANSVAVTDPGHFHAITSNANVYNTVYGRAEASESTYNVPNTADHDGDAVHVTLQASSKVTGVTVAITNADTGGGSLMNNLQPSILGTWFCKL